MLFSVFYKKRAVGDEYFPHGALNHLFDQHYTIWTKSSVKLYI
jgi:hypothetical protein